MRYNCTIYDNSNNEGGLFAGYINQFLKIKLEASGWPSEVMSEQEKTNFIDTVFEREGIALDRYNIELNPGLRCISKLALNSLWGKFGKREDLPQTIIARTYEEVCNVLGDPNMDVLSFLPSEEVIFINAKSKKEALRPLSNTSVPIACYTTAQARLYLYSFLERLGERALYWDTDSVIYVEKPGEWSPPIGPFLGDMTDELVSYGEGSYIVEFVSGGPKNYALKIACGGDPTNTKTVCKVKGIKIDGSNEDLICFENLKKLVKKEMDPFQVTIPKQIIRTQDHTVISKDLSKLYRVTYTKRRRVGEIDTLPYGFKDSC